MSARRVLVTGAAGFIGAGLTRRLLAEGHRVELLLRPGSDAWRLDGVREELLVHEADLRDREAVRAGVEAARAEWVFHLAAHGAYSWQTDAEGIFQSNTLGTLNLLESCIERGFDAFVHAGTSSEYGLKDHAPSEDEAPEPNSSYAVAKVAATLLCRQLADRHALHVSTLRLYSVYGPWEDPRRLVPRLVAHARRDELPPLVDPETARDFVHLDDVLDAFELAAARRVAGSSGIYNVGSGQQTSLRELVKVACEALEVSASPEWGTHAARAWDASIWVSDPSKIARELGWHAQRELHDGLREMSSWLEQNPQLAARYAS